MISEQEIYVGNKQELETILLKS